MAFWSTEKIRERQSDELLFDPFCEESIKHGAYEMEIGSEAFVTSTENQTKIPLGRNEQVIVASGQFGLLITEEIVQIPCNSIGFISMKYGIKSQGLINVSGFHVDPGFTGHLKFSVYNAGSKDIVLTRGDKVFLLWLADLDRTTSDSYNGASSNQTKITSGDQAKMMGQVASPGELQKQLDEVRNSFYNTRWFLTVLCGTFVGILIRLCFTSFFSPITELQLERIQREVTTDLRTQVLSTDFEELRKKIRTEFTDEIQELRTLLDAKDSTGSEK